MRMKRQAVAVATSTAMFLGELTMSGLRKHRGCRIRAPTPSSSMVSPTSTRWCGWGHRVAPVDRTDVAAVPRLAHGRSGGERLPLNLLSLQVRAAAEHLGAEICLATRDDNPPLHQAADHRGAALRLVGG